MSIAQPPVPALHHRLEDLMELLTGLYRRQLEVSHDEYLVNHSCNAAVIRRHIDVFLRYRPHVQGGRILDWGCRHAVDSCLLRATAGDQVELYGCDVLPPNFDVFHSHARLSFAKLNHRWKLPYEGRYFDAVIGSGVLEHVPNDSESLKEIHRVLKNDGLLVLTFLPNRTSVSEWFGRVRNRSHHLRLYSPREIRNMLLHHGFLPMELRFHQVLPTLAGLGGEKQWARNAVETAYRLNRMFELIPLVRRAAANLMVIAHKRNSM